jgi:hypothetical protein
MRTDDAGVSVSGGVGDGVAAGLIVVVRAGADGGAGGTDACDGGCGAIGRGGAGGVIDGVRAAAEAAIDGV